MTRLIERFNLNDSDLGTSIHKDFLQKMADHLLPMRLRGLINPIDGEFFIEGPYPLEQPQDEPPIFIKLPKNTAAHHEWVPFTLYCKSHEAGWKVHCVGNWINCIDLAEKICAAIELGRPCVSHPNPTFFKQNSPDIIFPKFNHPAPHLLSPDQMTISVQEYIKMRAQIEELEWLKKNLVKQGQKPAATSRCNFL